MVHGPCAARANHGPGSYFCSAMLHSAFMNSSRLFKKKCKRVSSADCLLSALQNRAAAYSPPSRTAQARTAASSPPSGVVLPPPTLRPPEPSCLLLTALQSCAAASLLPSIVAIALLTPAHGPSETLAN